MTVGHKQFMDTCLNHVSGVTACTLSQCDFCCSFWCGNHQSGMFDSRECHSAPRNWTIEAGVGSCWDAEWRYMVYAMHFVTSKFKECDVTQGWYPCHGAFESVVENKRFADL